MRKEQLAAQLFTVRKHIQTPGDIAASMKKIRTIGYTAVQVSGMGPIPEEELATILDGEGLCCCATHEKTDRILESPGAVVERLKKLNCSFTAVPSPGSYPVDTIDAVKAYARKINEAGGIFGDAGLTLTYHNHNVEFRRVGGKLILDIIYGETDPRLLQGEIDTYWVQAGGGSSVDWCRRLSGRLPLLHLKDYAVNSERRPVFAEVGYGNLQWRQIVDAADHSGCRWHIIEQDANWHNDDPFESLKMSYDWLVENICEK